MYQLIHHNSKEIGLEHTIAHDKQWTYCMNIASLANKPNIKKILYQKQRTSDELAKIINVRNHPLTFDKEEIIQLIIGFVTEFNDYEVNVEKLHRNTIHDQHLGFDRIMKYYEEMDGDYNKFDESKIIFDLFSLLCIIRGHVCTAFITGSSVSSVFVCLVVVVVLFL